MMLQGLELNISQKQAFVLTPQLLQTIRVLGMTRIELETYIADELEANPALEAVWEGDAADEAADVSDLDANQEREYQDERAPADRRAEDFDWAEYLKNKDYDDISYGYGAPVDGLADRGGERLLLSDFLLEQLASEDLLRISPDTNRAYTIVAWVTETLDENGFLTQDASEMASVIGVSVEEVLSAISVLQGLDPAGVAASDVRESLVLQYKRTGGDNPLVIEIIQDRLADVAMRSAAAVSKVMGRKRSEVARAFEIIATLDPKPGRGFWGGAETHYIIPDLIVEKTGDGYETKMSNAHLPRLTVSPYYRKLLSETKRGSEEYIFLTERLNAAVTMIKNLEQRGQTIYNVMVAILRRQHAFLDDGKVYLKPMTLRQIAEEVGVHESTVSRAVRGKYVQTPRGVIEIKHFFGAGVRTADGEGAAAENVKARIVALTAAEDKKTPLSDHAIAESLRKDGIFLSRRTVAKYRYEAGIPSSAKRARRR